MDIVRLPTFRPVVSASREAIRSIPSEKAIVASNESPTFNPWELFVATTRDGKSENPTQNVRNVCDEDDEHAQQTSCFRIREERGDEVAHHRQRPREAEEEHCKQHNIGILEHRHEHQRASNRDDKELEEVDDEP